MNTDPRRWGFFEKQDDGSFVFVPVPKTPLTLGGMAPPVTVTLYGGERTIVAEPDLVAEPETE